MIGDFHIYLESHLSNVNLFTFVSFGSRINTSWQFIFPPHTGNRDWGRTRKTKTYGTSTSIGVEVWSSIEWGRSPTSLWCLVALGLGWVGWDQNKDIGIVPVPRVITTVAQQPIRKKTSIHSVISFKPSQTGRTNFEMRVWWQNYTDNLC